MLAEEAVLLAFEGPPENPTWIPATQASDLLRAEPVGNINHETANQFISRILNTDARWRPKLHAEADARAAELITAHRRVREADRRPGSGPRRVTVRAQHPADLLAVYHYLPKARTA